MAPPPLQPQLDQAFIVKSVKIKEMKVGVSSPTGPSENSAWPMFCSPIQSPQTDPTRATSQKEKKSNRKSNITLLTPQSSLIHTRAETEPLLAPKSHPALTRLTVLALPFPLLPSTSDPGSGPTSLAIPISSCSTSLPRVPLMFFACYS